MLTNRDVFMSTHLRGKKPQGASVEDVMPPQVRAVNASAMLADRARESQRMGATEHPPITDIEIGDKLSAISACGTGSELAPTP